MNKGNLFKFSSITADLFVKIFIESPTMFVLAFGFTIAIWLACHYNIRKEKIPRNRILILLFLCSLQKLFELFCQAVTSENLSFYFQGGMIIVNPSKLKFAVIFLSSGSFIVSCFFYVLLFLKVKGTVYDFVIPFIIALLAVSLFHAFNSSSTFSSFLYEEIPSKVSSNIWVMGFLTTYIFYKVKQYIFKRIVSEINTIRF